MFRLTFTAMLLGTVASMSFAADSPSESNRLNVGCQTYTFNRFSLMEAIEKTAQSGGTIAEFYLGQRLTPTDKTPLGPEIKDDQIAAIHQQLKKHKVQVRSCYASIPNDEAKARPIFELAKKLGLKALTTESVESLDVMEKLAKEFDIFVAFHGHARRPNDPNYKLWNPEYVRDLLKGRDKHVGACPDTGHWASSGLKPIDGLKLLEGRIINVHLKDRPVLGRGLPDIVFGTGVCDIAGLVAELQRQKFQGNIFVEYENNWEDNVPDVAKCIAFVRKSEAADAK